jgi:hypothetical protein
MKDHGRRGQPGEVEDVPREQAVKELATYLRDRDARLMMCGPAHLEHLGYSLSILDEKWPWVCYIDAGFGDVLRTRRGPQVLAIARLPGGLTSTVSVVLVVPKTVPVAVLNQAFGKDDQFPDDDDHDVFPLVDPNADETAWPHLFLDAMELVSPGSTREIREATR